MEGMGTLAADSRADFYLLDRVINVMPNGAVPYKMKGTVIGIHGGFYWMACMVCTHVHISTYVCGFRDYVVDA